MRTSLPLVTSLGTAVLLASAGIAHAGPPIDPLTQWLLFEDNGIAFIAEFDPSSGQTNVLTNVSYTGEEPISVAGSQILFRDANGEGVMRGIGPGGTPLSGAISLPAPDTGFRVVNMSLRGAGECSIEPDPPPPVYVLVWEREDFGPPFTYPPRRELLVQHVDQAGTEIFRADIPGFWEYTELRDFERTVGNFQAPFSTFWRMLYRSQTLFSSGKEHNVAIFELDPSGDFHLVRVDTYSATDGQDGCIDGFDPRSVCTSNLQDEAPGAGFEMQALLHTFPASPSATAPMTFALWSNSDGIAQTFPLAADGRQFAQPTVMDTFTQSITGTSFSGARPEPCPILDPNFDPFADPSNPVPSGP